MREIMDQCQGLQEELDMRREECLQLKTVLANVQLAGEGASLIGGEPSEGACIDDLLSIKPGILLSALHSRAFRWLSAAPLVFLFLGFLSL